VKHCPICGATAGDDDAFCEADGAKLTSKGGVDASAIATPAGAPSPPAGLGGGADGRCPSCGAANADAGDGYCGECGHRLASGRATLPGAVPAKVGEFTVLRAHGDGVLAVRAPDGAERLLVFGAKKAIADEVAALAAMTGKPGFPRVLAEGEAAPSSYFVVALDGEAPTAAPALDEALRRCRAVLGAASALEEAGYGWEPAADDVRVAADGSLRLVRARGAHRLLTREPLNAKRVLEAMAPSLVPRPIALAPPEAMRLFVPAGNFSTSANVTIARATEVLERAVAAASHREAGALAALCDPGLKRDHNEDATAIAEGDVHGEPFKILVVCDGVSASTHAEQASTIASTVARDTLAHFARSGDILKEGSTSALNAAIRAAHLAICTSPIDHGDGPPPGTTIVAALVFRKNLTVGWVGDSRAYWVSELGAELCTTDHSWVNEAVARGEVTEAQAMQSPLAHALTRCLGPLDSGSDAAFEDVEPEVRTKALPGKGYLVLCTDGLWNYFPAASAIAALVLGAGKDATPTTIARFLVSNALAQGGGDNVSVAVLACP
jgi:serine/threonine protein phosphatase PrpC